MQGWQAPLRRWLSETTRVSSRNSRRSLPLVHSFFHRTSHTETTTRVLSFGDGSQGALGHGSPPFQDAYEPEEVIGLPSTIVSLGAGHYHSLAVSKEGQVFSWGRNSEGQLGIREASPSSWSMGAWGEPEVVRGMDEVKVTAVTGSGVVSGAMAEDGSLWLWGTSKRGQLGIGEGVHVSKTPRKVEGALACKRVKQVSLGWGHTVACTIEGEVYTWGYSPGGRLGYDVPKLVGLREGGGGGGGGGGDVLGLVERTLEERKAEAEEFVARIMEEEKDVSLVWEPKKVETLNGKKVVRVFCGMDHTLMLTEDGEVYSCGDISSRTLSDKIVKKTTSIIDHVHFKSPVLDISVSSKSSFAILRKQQSKENCLVEWNPSPSSPSPSPHFPKTEPTIVKHFSDIGNIVKVVSGRVHTCALTESGEVFTWGDGRSGRLGLGSRRDEEEPQLVEALCGFRVVDLACGLDHTLVLVEDS